MPYLLGKGQEQEQTVPQQSTPSQEGVIELTQEQLDNPEGQDPQGTASYDQSGAPQNGLDSSLPGNDTRGYMNMPVGVSNNKEANKAKNNAAISNRQYGAAGGVLAKPIEDKGDSWSAKYTAKDFLEEGGDSIARGIGKHIIGATGDLLQVAGAAFGFDVADGNALSRTLQEAGDDFAEKFKTYIPEELQGENISWNSLANPKFWSQNVAEMIPQLAEFIFLSKGAAAGTKKIASSALKSLGKKGTTALGRQGAVKLGKGIGNGKGIAGKLVEGEKLTEFGGAAASTFGGGLGGNLASGMLNAAEAVNTYKDIKGPDGQPLYSNDDLGEMAAGIIGNNLKWLALDTASFGMTYGGGWKNLKSLNPIKKGGKILSKAQRGKVGAELFKYDVSPILKGVVKLGGKMGLEALEETFQETYEEWIKNIEVAEMTGEAFKYNSYFDFYMSKENEGTKVMSAVMGGLGAGAFNLKSSFNKMAKDSNDNMNRLESFAKIVAGQGTEQEQLWNKFHRHDTIADIAVDDEGADVFDGWLKQALEKEQITEEESKKYKEMHADFVALKEKGKNLNVVGLKALMKNHAMSNYGDEVIEHYTAIAEENKATLDALETDNNQEAADKNKKLAENDFNYKKRMKAIALIKTQAEQNKKNLMLGRAAVPIDMEIIVDENGNDIVIGGLSTQDAAEQLLKDGETLKGDIKKYNDGDIVNGVAVNQKEEKERKKGMLRKLSSLGKAANKTYEGIIKKKEEGKESEPTKDTKESAEKSTEASEENSEESKAKSDESTETKKEDSKDFIEDQSDEDIQDEREVSKETLTPSAYKKFKETGEVSKQNVKKIADAIRSNKKLTEKQEEIRAAHPDKFKDAIASQNINSNTTTKIEAGDTGEADSSEALKNESAQVANPAAKDKAEDLALKMSVLEENSEVENKNIWDKARAYMKALAAIDSEMSPKDVDQAIAAAENEFQKSLADLFLKQEDSLTEEELDFIKNTVTTLEDGQTTLSAQRKKELQKKRLKFKKSNVKGSENAPGMDARNETEESKEKKITTAEKNYFDLVARRQFVEKIRNTPKSQRGRISQNELDNFLNSTSRISLYGPMELEKMIVVNHSIKQMFGNTKDMPLAIYTRNLLESTGSYGVGHILAGTVFIDENNWDDDVTFMHEMSHVYYRLSKDSPETQAIIKNIIKNKKLIAKTKEKYDDYILYDIRQTPKGKFTKITKGELESMARQMTSASTKAEIDAVIRAMISQKTLRTVPLANQDYIIEEAFVSQLEKPLAKNYDKTFSGKETISREADTKKFWGMIRKKGKVIQENGSFEIMMSKISNEDIDDNSPVAYFKEVFSQLTGSMDFSSIAMDRRATKRTDEEVSRMENVQTQLDAQQRTPSVESKPSKVAKSQKDETHKEIDKQDPTSGSIFFGKDFAYNAKGASKVLQRFGIAYNKVKRKDFLVNNLGKKVDYRNQPIFDRQHFESTIYTLAGEHRSPSSFILALKESKIKEIKDFYNFMAMVHPGSNLKLLASMHFVFANSTNVNAVRNTVNANNRYEMEVSMSNVERNRVDRILTTVRDMGKNNPKQKTALVNSVNAIYENKGTEQDFMNVLKAATGQYQDPVSGEYLNTFFNLAKIIDDGYVTHRGVSLPIETLLSGWIKSGKIFKDGDKAQGIDNYNGFRAIAESLVSTNRKFTPYRMVKNAEGEMEPVKITNNNLTNEVEEMVEFLRPNEDGSKPSLEDFLDRFSHTTKKLSTTDKDGNSTRKNIMLEGFYEDMQKGIIPTITQYHGIENISDREGNVYRNSTALEQGLESVLNFVGTSRTKSGKVNRSYLHDLGAFADSPRKYMMNVKLIRNSEVFKGIGRNKTNMIPNSKVINSIYETHKAMYTGNELGTRAEFIASLKNSIQETMDFAEDNADVLSKMDIMKSSFSNGKLTNTGIEIMHEMAINNSIHGYNVTDTFLPGVKGKNTAKRFKANSSPVFSIKNPNLKLEPIPISDEIIDNSVAGTDSAMYITEETANKLRQVGAGVFDMNNGFKILNSHIEKDNPKFKGKMAYLKGYTNIVVKGDPMHRILTERENKYKEWHNNKYGKEPSNDYTDGTPNHIAIAVPESSDKNNFYPEKFIEESKDGTLTHSEAGSRLTPSALNLDTKGANAYYDKMFYDSEGNFEGISANNFGPQQVMDKITLEANTPTQMNNSIIVNAGINGQLELAESIQQHIADQKQKNLQEYLSVLKEDDPAAYRQLIDESLNKEDMDQGQRILFEEGGSVASPYLVDIINNQLANSIRKEGNKLKTPGSYSIQRPDIGHRAGLATTSDRLKTYAPNLRGGLNPAQIILGKHMRSLVNSRQEFLAKNFQEEIKENLPNASRFEIVNFLKSRALFAARNKLKNEGKDPLDAENSIIELKNKKGQVSGYYIKGDTVIATRVPGHGPSSTGVFEVVGFDNGDGNSVQVPSQFNDIVGADNDGDALFIQTRSKKTAQADWNKAFDKITKYWLSPSMAKQITTKMDIEKKGKEVKKAVNKAYGKKDDAIHFPFSLQQRMSDYNNTMVSKRNVGPVFNIHKVANLLAAYNTPINVAISINGSKAVSFADKKVGAESRNQQSAELANIVLDNAKHGVADALGLDESNIAQASILINLGYSLEEVGMILNSVPAKAWSKAIRNNSSIFKDPVSMPVIKNQILSKILDKKAVFDSDLSTMDISISTKSIPDGSQDEQILNLLSALSDINSDVQKISGMMSGHNKIHVNPIVLEKQIQDFNDVIKPSDQNSTSKESLNISLELLNNPELQNYIDVAEIVLEKMKISNPLYRNSTNQVIKNVSEKMGIATNINHLEEMSSDVKLFNTARLLGLNNFNKEELANLMSKDHSESIFNKMKIYIQSIKGITDKGGLGDIILEMDNTLLFTKALSLNLDGNNPYISANHRMVDESFTEVERDRIQMEFSELPVDLRKELLVYDLLKTGWSGTSSIYPFLSKDTIEAINITSDLDMASKNESLDLEIMKELEKAIALKSAAKQNTPMTKIYLDKKVGVTTNAELEAKLDENPDISKKIQQGKPFYVKVIKGNNHLLYEFEGFTQSEKEAIAKSRQIKKNARELAYQKLSIVKGNIDNYHGIPKGNASIAMIADVSTGNFTPTETKQADTRFDPLVEATISYEEAFSNFKKGSGLVGMDAREDYDSPIFTRVEPLTLEEFKQSMEFNKLTSEATMKTMHQDYLEQKEIANNKAAEYLPTIEKKSKEDLLSDYETYGEKNVYAYAAIMGPLVKELASRIGAEQAAMIKKSTGVDIKQGEDVSIMKAYLASGSTIPSSHPASQAMVRALETEYKAFTRERGKYIKELNKVSDELYKEKLGYGQKMSFKNVAKRFLGTIQGLKESPYEKLYGNLVVRDEIRKDGKITFNYKLKPEEEIAKLFENGLITTAEKNFYDHFRKVTEELKPSRIKKTEKDYIPHTSMTDFEAFASRGLLGLMAKSRPEDDALYDVKMFIKENGEDVLRDFKYIQDTFKMDAASKHNKNNIDKIKQYRAIKRKAKGLLDKGKNEDGTDVKYSGTQTETALGFGAINRFANNRSVTAKEMPSMDLNKALGDYIHSTLFVEGNENLKGMRKMQGYVDGVLAYNREKGLPNMNLHVQKVWKDYFLRGKRQESFLGKKGDKVLRTLTRMNLFYSLGYSANANTGGLYAVGNIVAGKYHNIKQLGGKKWIEGELRYWGLDEGFKNGLQGVVDRKKRINGIMKSISFMDINVYDEVNMERKIGIDKVVGDLALAPMIVSENWIQKVHMLGYLTDEELNKFDDVGNYKEDAIAISNDRLVELEDKVKSQHGRGYQPTDQRALQMYSWGNSILQFSKFLPTMFYDRFGKEDVNIYGKKTIGSLTAVKKMVQYVVNNPKDFVRYRNSLDKDMRGRLDEGLKGMVMSAVIGGVSLSTGIGEAAFNDVNYYWNSEKLGGKLTPPLVKTINNMF
jgi:hypothetical protein